MIFKKITSFLLFIINLIKRALCCFRRRRRLSEFTPLTHVGVVANDEVATSELENWNDWNDHTNSKSPPPNTIQEHINYYRQQAIASRQVQSKELEVQENFFEDMTPTITKQTKVLINKNKDEGQQNRLSLVPENVNITGQELEEWDDNKGWEDETLDWDTREALKESRKQARQKKLWEQQQKKTEKNSRIPLGAKVYS